MRKYFAEFIGTMMLVVFGCGSAVAINTYVGADLPLAFTALFIAFAFGLIIVSMSYSIGNISGCHVNPAVSLGMLIVGKMSVKNFFGYIFAQFLGGLAGSGILYYLFLNLKGSCTYGANDYTTSASVSVDVVQAVVVEVVLTFMFVLAVLGVTSKKEYSSVAGLVIGLSLTVVHILGLPFTGTSVNPARSLGPAVFAGLFGGNAGMTALMHLPLFIGAPIIGAALAAFVYKLLSGKKED